MLQKAILYDTYSFPSEPHREFCHPVDQLMDRDLTIARTILTFFLPLFIIFVAYAGTIKRIYRDVELLLSSDLIIRVITQQRNVKNHSMSSSKFDARTKMLMTLVAVLGMALLDPHV